MADPRTGSLTEFHWIMKGITRVTVRATKSNGSKTFSCHPEGVRSFYSTSCARRAVTVWRRSLHCPFEDEDEDDDNPFSADAVAHKAALPDDDDYTPPRWLLKVVARGDAPESASVIPKSPSHREASVFPPLMRVHPVKQRKLYFSEKVTDPKNARSTIFYVTEEGQKPVPFDPAAPPNISVHQGDVEDWIIENRSQETHTFHIHQITSSC